MGRQVRLTAQAERAGVAYSTKLLRSYAGVLDQHLDSDLVSICDPLVKFAGENVCLDVTTEVSCILHTRTGHSVPQFLLLGLSTIVHLRLDHKR